MRTTENSVSASSQGKSMPKPASPRRPPCTSSLRAITGQASQSSRPALCGQLSTPAGKAGRRSIDIQPGQGSTQSIR